MFLAFSFLGGFGKKLKASSFLVKDPIPDPEDRLVVIS
jgi:hypothetical protein